MARVRQSREMIHFDVYVLDEKSKAKKRQNLFLAKYESGIEEMALFGQNLARMAHFLRNYFNISNKAAMWMWLNSHDPRCDAGKRTPLEILWQDGESGLQKIKDFLSSFRAGDFA